MTEVNLRDEAAGLEYTIECDLEKGLLLGWHVVCINPLPLQMAFNTPFLQRQAMAQSPCAQKAAAEPQHGNRKAIRIGPDGRPVERSM
jgi:hypothetical protein